MSTTTPRTVLCRRCGGTGTCPVCDGSGLNPMQDQPAVATPAGICRSCKGDKHCIQCGGKGRYWPGRAERPLRTSADPGFEICFGCQGSRHCQYCDGTAVTDDGACNVCEYGTCEVCRGEGQVRIVASTLGPEPRAIIFEQGHPTAADSPWGAVRVRITTDGRMEYEQHWGSGRRARQGQVSVPAVWRVIRALDRTAFPQAPQSTFLPGTSICKITVEPPPHHVFVDYFKGLKMDGYADVIRDLSALNAALRTDDRAVLDQWQFQEESATP